MEEGLEVAGSGSALARALRDEFERCCREALSFAPDGVDRGVIAGLDIQSGEIANQAQIKAGRETLASIDGAAAIERLLEGSRPSSQGLDAFNRLARIWSSRGPRRPGSPPGL